MDSITINWFWFGLLVVVIVRALAASSFGVRTFRDHHNTKTVTLPEVVNTITPQLCFF